tara:strand:+ start:448 stop:1101 length:654 start_codon:yes stop_codon:yes gene_type:complete
MNNLIKLKKRILDISHQRKLGHIGSCLSALEVIDEIYNTKKEDDLFVLSSGHSGLALYTVLEDKYDDIDADELFEECGVHPHRLPGKKIYCSTGSLGLGITVAVGFALANKDRDVYVMLSDGEIAEGSVWESLKFVYENNIENIHIYVNINGYSAISNVNVSYIKKTLQVFYPDIKLRYTNSEQFPFLKGIEAHYYVMSDNDYNQAINMLTEEELIK